MRAKFRRRLSPAPVALPAHVREHTLASMEWQNRITVNPDIRSGKPCVRGTRIAVCDVLEYLAGGMSEEQLLEDFPDLLREDIRACLAFAAARERQLANPALDGAVQAVRRRVKRLPFGREVDDYLRVTRGPRKL